MESLYGVFTQDTLQLGLHKDLRSGWCQAGPDLVIFDIFHLYPRRWHGLCIRMNNDRVLVLINNAVVLNINMTRDYDSQELAVQSVFIFAIIVK